MKIKSFLISGILSAAISLHAAVFIGPTTSTNRLVLATGQVAVITAIYPEKQYDGFLDVTNTVQLTANVVSGGQTTPIYIGECKGGTTALAGPAELVLTSPGVINYQLLTNTPIVTTLILPGSTNTINVPAGKSIKFMSFDLSGFNPLISDVQIVANGASFQGMDIYGDSGFDGPLTINFPFPSAFGPLAYVLPYYLADSSVVLPEQMALQSATGNVEIQLQKSSDLTNWTSAVAIPVTNYTKAFYRIRIAN